MFRPSDIVIEAFVDHLQEEFWRTFPGGAPEHCHAIARAARVALGHIARSNALYHDLSHTVLVTQIGQNLLQGRIHQVPMYAPLGYPPTNTQKISATRIPR